MPGARGAPGPMSVLSRGVVWGQPEAPPVFTGPVHHPGCGLGRCPGLCGRPAKEMLWHRARSGRAGAAGRGCGSERGVRDVHCPCGALASSTCPWRSPSSRLGRLAAATGWGAPGMGPLPGGGQRGPGETQGKQARGAVAAGERVRGTLGHTVSAQGMLPRAWSVSSRGPGRDRAGSGGQGSGRASEAGLRSWCRDPWWVLLAPGGTGGCRGDSWAEVGVRPGPAPCGW